MRQLPSFVFFEKGEMTRLVRGLAASGNIKQTNKQKNKNKQPQLLLTPKLAWQFPSDARRIKDKYKFGM